MEIRVVPDIYGTCPTCGAYWGNPDKSLDFPNRQKVDNHWKCYNPDCSCGFYDPETGECVELKPDPIEWEKRSKEIAAEVKANIDKFGLKVYVYNADGTVTDESIPPKED